MKTTWQQKDAMLAFISIEANFNLLLGKATTGLKGVVADAKLTNKHAWIGMAETVSKRLSLSVRWSAKDAERKWKSFKKNYVNVKVE